MWLIFNVLNFVFIWRSCRPNEQREAETELSEEEKLQRIAQQYALSERECEIAKLIFAGKNNKEMAELLYLSPNTVKVHASNLYRKLGVSNRVQAVQILGGKAASQADGNKEKIGMTDRAVRQGA